MQHLEVDGIAILEVNHPIEGYLDSRRPYPGSVLVAEAPDSVSRARIMVSRRDSAGTSYLIPDRENHRGRAPNRMLMNCAAQRTASDDAVLGGTPPVGGSSPSRFSRSISQSGGS